ncbi:NLI interacting factor-like phosphatase family protein [Tritrichomonas foetus]|uniref:Mitochondrial import inner membrane translocase subunit TIM50 n=1 Tax=Tritrichomonas foetus TaxID=1144522 RepID=A0A1J4JN18_9EUKA|nr:NLI interacting factor-like phosphatase family protein [Tritrichomonas foetus]|eukprot:OHT00082.1 NLI interacting factor-like phosphatase family protein [Tritrichomonas foetus]
MRKRSMKPSIIFDLDETLIHSFPDKQSNTFPVKVKEKYFYVRVRNGAQMTLDWLSIKFNIYIFTSASKEYADQIIDHIAPFIPKENRFYRDSIKYCNRRSFKDISIISRDLSKMLLIDNSRYSGLRQPFNQVVIKPWNGQDNDNILMNELYPVLNEIAEEENLPKSIRRHVLLNKTHGISFISGR